MNDDLIELLGLLTSHGVEFLVIGAHAVGFHGRPRYTEDLDLWVGPSIENASRLKVALDEFGTPIGVDGAERFATVARQMVRIGNPPHMVDILNFAGNEPFEAVLRRSVEGDFHGLTVRFPCLEDLVEIKGSANRPQDRADIERLRGGSR
jgi:predicted nucleotidyltransferase